MLAIRYRGEFPLLAADVQLPWPADSRFGGFHHLFPVGNPSDRPANRKHHSKHVGRKTECPQNYARIEVDIGIEFFLLEVCLLYTSDAADEL